METISTVIGQCFLTRTKRRTLAISVLPHGVVEVVAPLNAGMPEIQKKIQKRAGWIRRQRRQFLALNVDRPKRRYCTGATHRYLGRQYRLKVTVAGKAEVKLRGAYLHIQAKSATSAVVARLLADWMRAKAQEQFERRLIKWKAWCDERGLPAPRLRLLDMPKRWGSTHSDGRMYLNPELVRAPAPCVDYVIVHEVCHIKHPRHDKGFFKELEKLCPQWRALKHRLETSEL